MTTTVIIRGKRVEIEVDAKIGRISLVGPCDCGKGEWCPQFGSAFKAAQKAAIGRRG